MAVKLIPGGGYLQETGSGVFLIPGAGYVQKVSAGGATQYTITPTGGVVFSGAAVQNHVRAQAVSGGVSFSGTAPISTTPLYTITPSGGVVMAGAVSLIRTKRYAPTGGTVFAGNAGMIFIPAGGAVGGQENRISIGASRAMGLS